MKIASRFFFLLLLLLLFTACQVNIGVPPQIHDTPQPLATFTALPTTAVATATSSSPINTPAPPPTNTPPPNTPPPPTNTPIPPVPTATPKPTPSSTAPYYHQQAHPEQVIASYFNAINRQEYQRAYGYWESPTQTYTDFVAGFATTASVNAVIRIPNMVEGAAGSLYTAIPTLILATHTDGSRHVYRACYVLRRSNLEEDAPWDIYQADATIAANANVEQLAQACTYGPPPPDWVYDEQDTPLHMIGSYINAIDQQDYHRAYGYWESNPQTYADFAAGFADTASVMAVARLPVLVEGAAGSQFARVATLLVATHTDGSHHFYRACYETRRSNMGPPTPSGWMIFRASANVASNTDAWQLFNFCGP